MVVKVRVLAGQQDNEKLEKQNEKMNTAALLFFMFMVSGPIV
jgi:hypothetical protein